MNQNYLTSVTTKQLEVNKIPVNSLKEGEIVPFFFRFLVQIPFDQTLILAPVGGAVKYPQNLEQISQLSNGQVTDVGAEFMAGMLLDKQYEAIVVSGDDYEFKIRVQKHQKDKKNDRFEGVLSVRHVGD